MDENEITPEVVEEETVEETVEQEAARIATEAEKLRLLEGTLAQMKRMETLKMFHRPTAQHSNKSRGVGITRKVKEQSKKARKQSKESRRINRGK